MIHFLIQIATLSKSSTNVKTQIDYCFTNMNDLKSDYLKSLTSFHKLIWIRKHKISTIFHVDESEQISIDLSFYLEELEVSNKSYMIEVEEESSIKKYEVIDSTSRKVLDQFLFVLDFDNIIKTDQISSQAQIINDLIKNHHL